MKRLPLLLTAALMVLLAACSEPPASPELEGQWSGSAGAYPMSFEVEPGGQVFEHSFVLEYGEGTLAIEVDSHAAGKSINIAVLAVHGNGDRLEFELNGEVNGDTLAGTYHLKLTVGSDVTETSGTFSLTRLPG